MKGGETVVVGMYWKQKKINKKEEKIISTKQFFLTQLSLSLSTIDNLQKIFQTMFL